MTIVNPAPDEMVEWLLENAISPEQPTEENYRDLIEAVWQRAQRQVSGFEAALTQQQETEEVIAKRLRQMKEMIFNLSRKNRHLPVPTQFAWATTYGMPSISGVYRNTAASYASPNYVSLHTLNARKTGKFTVNFQNDFVRVDINQNKTMVPLRWFKISEGDLAKIYRDAARKEAAETYAREKKKLEDKKRSLDAELAKLVADIAKADKTNPARTK